MVDAKPISTPLSTIARLSKDDVPLFHDFTLYQSTVGGLRTSPLRDLILLLRSIKFVSSCTSPWLPTGLLSNVFYAISKRLHHGLFLSRSSSRQLNAFSDADWVVSLDDRKSTSSFVVFLGSNLVSWSSRKQQTVARSSTEAKYKSLTYAALDLLWLKSLLYELGYGPTSPPILWCDNLGDLYLTTNPVFHARTKHVEIDFHFVRDHVQKGHLQVQFIHSFDQLADGLTKPLLFSRFAFLRDKLNFVDPTLSLQGHDKDHSNTVDLKSADTIIRKSKLRESGFNSRVLNCPEFSGYRKR